MELPALLNRLREPPPRAVTGELMRACETSSRPMLMWGGVALASTGSAYSVIFAALRAPWQILGGALATALIGVALLLAFAVVTRRLSRLLRDGLLVTGEILAVQPPRRLPPSGVAFGRVTYRFTMPTGTTITGRRPVPWTTHPPQPAPGDPLPVCALAEQPRRHLPLL